MSAGAVSAHAVAPVQTAAATEAATGSLRCVFVWWWFAHLQGAVGGTHDHAGPLGRGAHTVLEQHGQLSAVRSECAGSGCAPHLRRGLRGALYELAMDKICWVLSTRADNLI